MHLINLAILGLRFWDVIDIVMVAFILYGLYNFLKGTAAINIFFGILAIFLVWKVVDALNMQLLREILGAFISVGFIALIVVFQPEIRKFLLLLGTPSFIHKNKKQRFFFWHLDMDETAEATIESLVQACTQMGKEKTGALIIIKRKNGLKQYLSTGEAINADVGAQLLRALFFKNSPLHDGAVIISENKIAGARCILPVSDNNEIPPWLGLRHRAAAGITEVSDAIAIIVSEETGGISLGKNGKLENDVSPLILRQRLNELLEINIS